MIFSQIDLKIYETTDDYMNSNPIKKDIAIEIKTKEHDFLHIKNFYASLTNKSLGQIKLSWAIRYDDIDYFNLFYYNGTKGIFIPLHRGKKYCTMTLSHRIYQKYSKPAINSSLQMFRSNQRKHQRHADPFKKPNQYDCRILYCDPSQKDHLQNSTAKHLNIKDYSKLISGRTKSKINHTFFIEANAEQIQQKILHIEK